MSFYYRTMARASVASNGTQSNGFSDSQHTSISADGRYVVFTSLASNLVSGDTNNGTDVFVYDRTTQQTKRVSVTSAGEQSPFGGSAQPAISADGRYIAFIHSTGNLAPNIQIIVSGATPTACKHFLVPS
jgi:Tol biopolymer transport system component